MTNYIALAIPFFFVLIGAELLWARARGVRVYRFNDALVDLSCGTAQQVLLVFAAGALVWVYARVYEHRLVSWSDGSPWPWLIAFVLVDFTYYWWHRLSHEVNFLWAAHVVHHSSEDYNLAVALRQSVTTAFTILPFHLPLALLGISPLVLVTVDSFSTLYQFWIHTELIGELGWFEWLFNTPAQHRVHHAINPQYLDKNYAATLCIWDRLFGTFEREVEKPVFGLVKPLGSFNPLWAQVHFWGELAAKFRAAPSLRAGLEVLVRGPAWQAPWLAAPVVPPLQRDKHDARPQPELVAYVWVQLVLTMSAVFVLLLRQYTLPLQITAPAGVLVGMTLLSWGGLLERRAWAVPLELSRLAALALFALAVAPSLAVAAGAVVACAACAAWFWSRRGEAVSLVT